MTLDASKLPEIDEGQPIRDAVIDFTEAGSAINTVAGNIHRTWQGLAPQYSAPEQHLVLQAMNTPQTKAKDLWDKAVKAGKALTTYANRCDELRAQRATLVKDIGDFYKKKEEKESSNSNPWEWAKDHSGWDDFSLLREEEGLLGRANQLQADLDEAQRTCANSIGAIYGGPRWEATGQASVNDKTVYGFTKDGYEEMAKSGDTPWGAPEGWKGGSWLSEGYMVAAGAWDTIASTGGFIWDLTGLSEDGEAAAAWSGIWQLTKDAARYSSPAVLALSAALDPKGTKESGERLLNVGKATIGWGKWDDSPYQTAGGFVPDIIAAVASGGTSAAARGTMKAAMSSLARHAPGVAGKVDDLAAASRAMKTSMVGTLDKLTFGNLNLDVPTPDVRPDVDMPTSSDIPNAGTPDRSPDVDTAGLPDAGTPDRTPDTASTPNAPVGSTPETPATPNTPDAPSKPDAPEATGTPDAPVAGKPDTPETAGSPDVPAKPDAPEASATPDSPAGAKPDAPEHAPSNPAEVPGNGDVPDHAPGRQYDMSDGTTHETRHSPEQVASNGTPWREAIRDRMAHHGWDEDRLRAALDTPPNKLSDGDRAVLKDLRDQIQIDEDTVLSRVIRDGQANDYIAGRSDDEWFTVDETYGFTARAVDTADMATPQDLFDRLALGYHNNPFEVPDGRGGTRVVDEMHVLRFRTNEPENLFVPRDSSISGGDLPRQSGWDAQSADDADLFTGNGWTAGPGGVPELHPAEGIKLPDGAEMWRVNSSGTQELRAVLKTVNGKKEWVEVA